MEKFTMIGDVAVHFTDSEKGSNPVLLLHGYMESLDVWEDFRDRLSADGYRVITMDIPGHGISEVLGETHTMEMMADVAVKLLDKLKIERANVIGHSMGGYVALAMAKKYPGKMLSLTLFSSTPNADTEEKKENRRREIEIVASGRKEMLSKVLPGKGFAPANRKRMQDEIDWMALQVMLTEDEGIMALLRGMMEREDMNGMLKESKVPQLFLFGKKDEYITIETAEEVAMNNSQAKVAWLEESGHNGFLEQPEESVRIVEEFIGKPSTDADQE